MNKDVGKTIQNWAIFLCAVGVIASIIGGIYLLTQNNLFGLALGLFGTIISCLVYYLMDGFGELVTNSGKILSQSCAISELLNNNSKLGLQKDEENKQEQEIQTGNCEEELPNE